jgi:DNA invertase Pin-like site-specific DNA recombinase
MNKITADHLTRRACVYIRQSTPEQVRHNLESKRRQYGLVDHARALGWQDIDVIDDDLGISGSGIRRPGFERLLSAVCDGQVGAVFSTEASRLARTNREWHTLLEFCNIVGVLLIDAEAVYDPRLTNDRLLLGMKGTISEMEVASFRERAQAAILQKAQRGALIRRVPNRLHQRNRGPHREGSGCQDQDRHRSDLPQICGIGQRATGLFLAGSAANSVAHCERARRDAGDRLAARSVPRRAERVEESDLRGSVRVWAQQDRSGT